MKHVLFATTYELLLSDIIPTDWQYHTIYNYLGRGEVRQLNVRFTGIPCMARSNALAEMPEVGAGLGFTMTGGTLPDYGITEFEEVRVSVASWPSDEVCANLLLDAVSNGEWKWWYANDGSIFRIFNK